MNKDLKTNFHTFNDAMSQHQTSKSKAHILQKQ